MRCAIGCSSRHAPTHAKNSAPQANRTTARFAISTIFATDSSTNANALIRRVVESLWIVSLQSNSRTSAPHSIGE